MFNSPLYTIILSLMLNKIFLENIASDSIDLKNKICDFYENCNYCEFCGNITKDYSYCNFGNLFCYYNENENYEYNSVLKEKYSNYFHSFTETKKFCGIKNITLNSMKKSFTFLKTNFNSEKLLKLYHCDYIIKNTYYYHHESDIAKLHIEIKKLNKDKINENTKIKFIIYLIYNIEKSKILVNLTDDLIRNSGIAKPLDKISEIEILIDFKNNFNVNLPLEESLELRIITENPSKKYKIILIVGIIFSIIAIILIVILIIFFVFLKSKYMNENNNLDNEIIEKEKKIEKNKGLIKKLFEMNLQPKIFNKDIIINDCENCSICLEAFECAKSQVSITPCNHIFHYDCIKKWIEDNVLSPQCPNCKFAFLENLLDSSVVNVKKKISENNNNDNINNKNNINNENNQEEIRISHNFISLERRNNGINSRDNLYVNN